jgi:integrase
MGRIKLLPHIHSFRNRHGTLVHYFRRKGYKTVRLRGVAGSSEFMAAYAAAVEGQEPIEIGAKRSPVGTVAATVGMYLSSVAFADLADGTQQMRRGILERFREAHGDKHIDKMERKHVQALIDAKAATPGAARNLLVVIRLLMQFAIDAGIRDNNPALGVKCVKVKSDGFPTWEEHHIAAYEARHPLGTMARLAFELALGTGQRRADLVQLGRQHVRGDMIAVRQQKTKKPLMIPIGNELRAAIDAMPVDCLTFITTARGEPFSPPSFTMWFRNQCQAAGLPVGYSVHGLRKAMCRRLAEAGCTEKQIAAISGHKTLRMMQHYTQAADQERMARAAIEQLGNDSVAHLERRTGSPRNRGKTRGIGMIIRFPRPRESDSLRACRCPTILTAFRPPN